MREKIDLFLRDWERKAKSSMHLDGYLHPAIRRPLIDGFLKLAIEHGANFTEPAPVKPALTEAVIADATEKAKEHAITPKADGTLTASKPKRSPEEEAQMAALKAQLASAKKKKGKAA